MSRLCESEHFVWCVEDTLGSGATSNVYKSRHKKTGEEYAVKVAHDTGNNNNRDNNLKESSLLMKLDHKNVIRLVAFEKEQTRRVNNDVMVMECCFGGSLYSVLDQPANFFGLEEAELLIVVRDIAQGMKYLREQNVCHRDIKPGNIMKFVKKDGSSLYKLTDFGAAKKLMDDEQFQSLYGTEEYLRPDMYQRALMPGMRNFRNQYQFDATVDLWSLGVTLYHIATGSLPFQAFGGRRNREIMYKITTEKERGVISGIQKFDNGPIVWSSKLPETCALSSSLQQLLVPIIAGLVESDTSLSWSFEQFFSSVEDLLSRVSIHCFSVNSYTSEIVYLLPEQSLTDLKDAITKFCFVPADNQYLLFDGYELSVRPNQPVCDYTKTQADKPIIVCNLDANETPVLQIPEPLTSPSFNLAETVDLVRNYKKAREMAAVAHRTLSQIEHCRRAALLIREVILIHIRLFLEEVTATNKAIEHHNDILRVALQRLRTLDDFNKSEVRLCNLTFPTLFDISDLDTIKTKSEELLEEQSDLRLVMIQSREEIEQKLEEFRREIVNDWDNQLCLNTFPWPVINDKGCVEITKHSLIQIDEIVQKFLNLATSSRDKKRNRDLNEQLVIHRMDLLLLQRRCAEINKLLTTDSVYILQQTQKNVLSWLSKLSEAKSASHAMNADVRAFAHSISSFQQGIDTAAVKLSSLSNNLWEALEAQLSELGPLSSIPSQPSSGSSRKSRQKVLPTRMTKSMIDEFRCRVSNLSGNSETIETNNSLRRLLQDTMNAEADLQEVPNSVNNADFVEQ